MNCMKGDSIYSFLMIFRNDRIKERIEKTLERTIETRYKTNDEEIAISFFLYEKYNSKRKNIS